MKRITGMILALIMIVTVCPIQIFAVDSYKLNETEKAALNNFSTSLINNDEVVKLKKLDKLDGFIELLSTEYDRLSQDNLKTGTQLLEKWGISMNSTVAELKDISAEYLNKIGIDIDSREFDEYNIKCINSGEDIFAKAQKDYEFAPVYIYMCLRSEMLDSDTSYIDMLKTRKKDIYSLRLEELLEADFQYNYAQTKVPELLRNYYAKYVTATNYWPSLNGSKIQNYAIKWSKTDSGNTSVYVYINNNDCTNFASQCLFAGGLTMNCTNSDLLKSGYTETTSKWYHIKNTSSAGYSISTSWVRVNELYTYLSPHYATHEAYANGGMTPYLNKGFLLQGKPLIGKYKHSVIVTKKSDGSVCYCAHSSRRNEEPILTFYNGFYKCRVIQMY